jgi:hypothetical protein
VVRAAVMAPAPFLFSKISFAENNCGLSAHMHREGYPRLSAKGAFPGRAPPRGLRREHPLGEGSAVRIQPFTERIPALGEGSQSGSECKLW